MEEIKSAEEILEDNMNESLWTFINTYPVACKSDKMLKDWIIDAMQAYHSQFVISDEEIKKESRQQFIEGYSDIFVSGADWYRAELERRGK